MVNETLHGFINANGTMQAESNDRELRILLKRSVVFDKGQQFETFCTVYYVKEGFGWQQTNESSNYHSADDFLDAIRKSDDFTLAVCDIEEQKKGVGTVG